MYLKVCEHPLRLKENDPNTNRKHYIYVPCGKCKTCLNHKTSGLVERLEQESQCHSFTCFFTLTYDEKHCPRLFLGNDGILRDFDRNLTIDTSVIPNFNSKSRLYVHRRKDIPYYDFKDVQDFLKRLRYYIESLLLHTNENKKIRYYIISEYGKTYRPHYHGLLWFDSKKIALRIHELISKSWSLGRIDAQFSRGKSHRYVAQYISGVNSLPKIYLHPKLKPKSVSSKFPSIGTLAVPETEIREIFETGSVERVLHSQQSHKSKVSPLWRSLENRLFPKIAGFNDFNHTQRVALYSVYSLCPEEGFQGFLNFVKNPVFWQNKVLKFKDSSYHSVPLFLFDDSYLHRILYGIYKEDLENFVPSPEVPECLFNRLKNLYYTSSKVYWQRHIFGVSLDYYVTKIENYYQNKENWKLKRFYQFQQEYVKDHPAYPLVFMYHEMTDYLNEVALGNIIPNENMSMWLDTFGFHTQIDDFELLNCDILLAVSMFENNTREFVEFNKKIAFNMDKSKKRNTYLDKIIDREFYGFNLDKNYE